MKTGAVVQARTSSKRLPGKVLMDLPYGSGITALQQVIRRLKRTKKLDDIIVATSTDKADTEIIELSEKENVVWFRGSISDVLERYYLAAKENDLDVIVRVTGDCPCIDPEVVDLVVSKHISKGADFTSNTLNRTFPHGLDTEVLNFDSLEKAHLQAKEAVEREHVCPYIYKSNPGMFNISSVEAPPSLYAPDIRITLDTEEDYALLCTVFDYLYPEDESFGTEDILRLFCNKPWLKIINKNVVHKKIFESLQQEVEEAMRILELQELERAKKLLAKYLR
ncbi:MAG: cytidylyltransferase domain-containing protein [Planctomycetota bacterium]|jgi:spore coat polysaccharide biosynthesis protein SpsF